MVVDGHCSDYRNVVSGVNQPALSVLCRLSCIQVTCSGIDEMYRGAFDGDCKPCSSRSQQFCKLWGIDCESLKHGHLILPKRSHPQGKGSFTIVPVVVSQHFMKLKALILVIPASFLFCRVLLLVSLGLVGLPLFLFSADTFWSESYRNPTLGD